jgi:hypothetical protein
VFFHPASGTVLFCDLLQQFPSSWFRGWRAIVARLDLMVGDEPAVPRKFRLAQTDRGVARQALQQILAWPARAGADGAWQAGDRSGAAVSRPGLRLAAAAVTMGMDVVASRR